MSEFKKTSLVDIKAKQYRNLLIMASLLASILHGLYWFLESENKASKVKPKITKTSFTSPIAQVDPQTVWLERAENQLKTQQQQTSKLKEQFKQLEIKSTQSNQNSNYQNLQQQIETLQKAFNNKDNHTLKPVSPIENQRNGSRIFPTLPGATTTQNKNMSEDGLVGGIDNDELHLTLESVTRPQKNPDSFVPAGTFVEAIMLGAADAAAGVMNQANPSPMLFRIIAEGTLPNHHKSHLKDCVVTAAVIGDISSERGEIRLERLSCVFPNSEIVEQPVEGTVFGIDAKNGVRGNPVWREGGLLERAAVAGTLSGLANGISQKYITNSISPLGTTQTISGGDIFQHGVAMGATNAMEKLADYQIQRAERYHPIIQLSAGQSVDLVFLKGFYLDGKKYGASSKESSNQPELFPAKSHKISALTLSEAQLSKINQHEKRAGWQ